MRANVNQLRGLAVPRCGWSDLGTPERLARCAARLPRAAARAAFAACPVLAAFV